MNIYTKLILIIIINCCPAFSQDLAPINHEIEQMKNSGSPQSYLTVLSTGGSHSRSNAPQPLIRFSRCYFLILPSEMSSSGFPSGVNINSLGFNYQYGTDLAVTGYFKVYFQNTSDLNSVKTANWNEAISNMTLVHSDSLTIQTSAGIFDIPLNAPENFTYSGGGIYIAFEFSNPSNPVSGFSNVSWANRDLPAPILRYSQDDDSMKVIATASTNLRPETRLGCSKIDIAEVGLIYAMGVVSAKPCIDTCIVKFQIRHTRTNTDTIITNTIIKNILSGSVKFIFTDTIISSEIGNTLITKKYLPDGELGTDSIIVNAYASGEEMIVNNRRTYLQTTSVNLQNHFIPSLPPDGSIGLNSGNGDCVARFKTSCTLNVCGAELSFYAETNQGNNPYKVVIYAGDGPGGLPGTLLHLSPQFISPPGSSGIVKRLSYFLSEPVDIYPGNFYVGYSQTGNQNIRISYQVENPVRSGEFFFTTSLGSSNWIAFDQTTPFRIDIAPRTYLSLNMKSYLQGFYDGDVMIPDTVRVILRSQSSPFAAIDSAVSIADSNGNGKFNFIKAHSDSCYYFDVRHRNHLQTFSHASCEKLNASHSFYDFTDGINKALGANMVFAEGNQSGGGFAFYGGDCNQDGNVNLADLIEVFNDAVNFRIGYLNTDITGDEIVDLTDISITYNNSISFVAAYLP